MGEVLKRSVGVKEKRKCAKRKFINMGTIVGHSVVLRSEENVKKMKNGLALSVSMSETNSMEDSGKEDKKKEALSKHNQKFPAAASKLYENSRVVRSLTMAEIEDILHKVHIKTMGGHGGTFTNYKQAR